MLKAAIEPVFPARMAVLFGLRGAGPSPPCHYVKGIVGGARGRLLCTALLRTALLCSALHCTARSRRVPQPRPDGDRRCDALRALRFGCAVAARSRVPGRSLSFDFESRCVVCERALAIGNFRRCVSFFLKCFFFFPQIRTLFLPEAAMSLRFIFFLFKRNKTTQSSISFGVLLCPISLVVLEVPPDALSPPAFCVSPL